MCMYTKCMCICMNISLYIYIYICSHVELRWPMLLPIPAARLLLNYTTITAINNIIFRLAHEVCQAIERIGIYIHV